MVDLNILKEETNIIIFPDGQLFYGDISHDMLIYNTVREHAEYSDILYEIEEWMRRFEDSDTSCWGYSGLILGHDFSMRHNIVKIYGIDTFRTDFLLCAETANNLTKAQVDVLFQIKDLFSNMDQNNIKREYNNFYNIGE
jgi:hypothetical protein